MDVARRQVAAPIVDRAAEFDEWAVVAAPALLRFAHVITRSDHDASDAVQDALLAVYGSWRRLRRDDAYEAYARRVIVNKTISRWRRIGRRERALDELGGLRSTSQIWLRRRPTRYWPTSCWSRCRPGNVRL